MAAENKQKQNAARQAKLSLTEGQFLNQLGQMVANLFSLAKPKHVAKSEEDEQKLEQQKQTDANSQPQLRPLAKQTIDLGIEFGRILVAGIRTGVNKVLKTTTKLFLDLAQKTGAVFSQINRALSTTQAKPAVADNKPAVAEHKSAESVKTAKQMLDKQATVVAQQQATLQAVVNKAETIMQQQKQQQKDLQQAIDACKPKQALSAASKKIVYNQHLEELKTGLAKLRSCRNQGLSPAHAEFKQARHATLKARKKINELGMGKELQASLSAIKVPTREIKEASSDKLAREGWVLATQDMDVEAKSKFIQEIQREQQVRTDYAIKYNLPELKIPTHKLGDEASNSGPGFK